VDRKIIKSEERICDSIESLHKYAQELVGAAGKRHCYLLLGDLGAGKTEWTRGACAALGINEVSSPTFSLQNQYSSSLAEVFHFDLYRLENAEDIVTSGLWDAFERDSGIIIIEWANQLNLSEISKTWPVTVIEFGADRKLKARTLK
jgi:tRNA threonylcarbamoyladenosine biosynthesis protein TsaE